MKFKNPWVLKAWHLILGFFVWNLWKERNLRVLDGKCIPFYMVQKLICNNIRESLIAYPLDSGDGNLNEEEVIILKELNLEIYKAFSLDKVHRTGQTKEIFFQPPP